MHSNPMHATTTGAGAVHLVGETNNTHNDPAVDEEINMHSNPMHAAAITAGETAEGKEEHRAADRLGVLYSIYKPECFYFDIINFFHVSLHSPGPQPLLNALSHMPCTPLAVWPKTSSLTLSSSFPLAFHHCRNSSSGRRWSSSNVARFCRWVRVLSSTVSAW